MHELLLAAKPPACGRHGGASEFEIGDTVDVHTRIQEGGKERIQIYSGVVMARSGRGTAEMFTVRRIVAGEGVERSFPIHSPKIAKLEVKRHGRVRRAKLYYLQKRVGKSTRLTGSARSRTRPSLRACDLRQ